jgi:hypothetical protein
MSSQNRRPEEVRALTIAGSLFEVMYGPYSLIPEVIDKPDAALQTPSGKTIGVEIVGMDSNEYLHYTNKAIKQIKKNIPRVSNKNYVGDIGTTRIYLLPEVTARTIVNKKNVKYEAYASGSIRFDEIILLIHTQVLSVTDRLNFPSQAYLYALEKGLRDGNFRFDRAILVDIRANQSVEVYQKNHPKIERPKNFIATDWLDGSHYLDQRLGIIHLGVEGGTIVVDGSLTEISKIVNG